jgi:hypothetical protein
MEKKKSIKQAVAENSPFLPPKYEVADAAAIQALLNGVADSHQQQRALKWIIEVGAGTYDLSYRPGVEGERDTAFAEGRRFVGLNIVKLTRVNVSKLRSAENVVS